MKTKIFLPLGAWLLLLCLQASAQYSFSGRITTAAKVPVEGATIMLQGRTRAGAVSRDSGAFVVRHVAAGDYRLHISCLGYKTVQKDVRITGSVTDTTIVLEKTGLFIRPVEILSTRAGKDAPFTQTTLSASDISQKNLGQDLPFLLRDQPSVITTSDAGAGVGYTNIWIRGSDVTRINVTFNGIPVNDAESAGTFWVDIPDIASSTGSIQVQRGVGTSTNGAGAFGATINLSTNTFHAKPYGELMSSFGSFNTWKHEISAGSGLLNGHFTVDARLSSISSDGYIDRASSDLASFYFSTAYLSKKSALRLNIFSGKEKTYQAWDGVPADSLATHRTYNDLGLMPDGKFYSNQTDNYVQTYYQLFWNQELTSNLNFNVAAFLTRGKGYYEEYKAAQPYAAYGLEDPVIGTDTLRETDLIRDLWLDNYYYGAIFSVNKTARRWKWTLGGGWDRYDGKHYGDVVWARYAIDKDYRYYYNTANKNDFNIYWKADRELTTRLHAFLDLQYRHIRYNIYGYDDNPAIIQLNTYDFFNPKAGLSYRFDHGNRLYLSYARASKEPNRDDFEAGRRQTPKAEHLGDWELGYDRQGSRYQLHGNLYYMNYRNQLVLTGKINDVGAYTRTNIPRSYRLGLELNGEVSFGRIWTFSANAAFSRNRIVDFTEYIDDYDNGSQKTVHHGTTDISFSPSLISGAALAAAPLPDLSITFRGKYVSRLYLDNSSRKDRSLDPYLVNSLQLQYGWHPRWIRAVRLNLMINNLFNIKYLTNGYTYSYVSGGQTYTENSYFPQAGLNFLAGLTVDL